MDHGLCIDSLVLYSFLFFEHIIHYVYLIGPKKVILIENKLKNTQISGTRYCLHGFVWW